MPPPIDVLPRARADILALAEYAEAYTDDAAERLIDELTTVFERLAAFPGMGRLREDLASGLRAWPIRSRRVTVFYREGGAGIVVERIIRQQRDLDALDF